MTAYAAVDLFGGVGGATLGLQRAGFGVTAYERWEAACKVHEQVGPVVRCDLMTYDWSRTTTPDLLWGSAPCQPFSSGGKGEGEADERDCVPAFIRAVDELRPPVWIFENVKGLTFQKSKAYLTFMLDVLRGFGYTVDHRVIDCSTLGLPQRRQRFIAVGTAKGCPPFKWPEPRSEAPPTMAEALGISVISHHQGERVEAGGWPHLTGTLSLQRRNNNAGPVDAATQPAPTVVTVPSQWVLRHPDGDLSLVTVEQAATLQGFPPDFVFAGSKATRQRMIGNAVPPLLAAALGRSAARCLGGRIVKPPTIYAAGDWNSNADLIADVASLGYLPSPVLDPTYGKGKWWAKWRPIDLYATDIDPTKAPDRAMDFRDLKFFDGSFASAVFDPPYVAPGGRKTSTIDGMNEAFGMQTTPKSPAELQKVINDGLTEIVRAVRPRGFIVVKCMDYISSGKLWIGTHHTLTHALSLGCTLEDRFEHVGSPGPQPTHNLDGSLRRQVHSRRNLSTLLVLRKGRVS